MARRFDAAIIGGGIIGVATGYYLSQEKLKVVLLERKFLCSGSTGRCIGGIRQQFTTKSSIKVAMESVKIFEHLSEEFGFDVEWHQGGYLFLAHSEDKEDAYKKAIEIQRGYGLDVSYISPEEARDVVPSLNTDGLLGAAYCPTDGQANPFLVVDGYARGIRENRGEIVTFAEVVGIKPNGNFLVKTRDEQYEAPVVINAAGPWAAEVCRMVGIDIPAEPDRHEALITERYPKFMEPMVVDYRADGCYFQQLHSTGQLIGCYTPDPKVSGKDLSSTSEFLREMGKRMVRVIPATGDIRVLRQWSGSYTMSPDGSPIVGPTDIDRFYVAVAMSGHGFMFGPGIGRSLAEVVVNNRSSIDISEFDPARQFGELEALK
ncbi:MAG TPA: FAD-binding oxidoreductase [bacterium (Candidatus Stahlbacteria)]|nr:FAD-binding oxidoreductase [Candidatus Stahlbacteria bacterium]